MAVVLGKLYRKVFENPASGFHVYGLRIHGGKHVSAVYQGSEPPKALKTVEYVLCGEWEKHSRYGKQFMIRSVERSQVANQAALAQLQQQTQARKALVM